VASFYGSALIRDEQWQRSDDRETDGKRWCGAEACHLAQNHSTSAVTLSAGRAILKPKRIDPAGSQIAALPRR
jgi:hypothetical protein